MSEKHVTYKVEKNTAWLVINREKRRNTLSPEAVSLFHEYLDIAEKDDEVRALCITGSGDRAFCCGAELGNAVTAGEEGPFASYANMLKRISGFPKPTVARVNGFCLAGGMGLMLACDIVLAEEGSRFGTPEVNVGLFPMMIGALIFRNMDRKKAMEMVLLGERMTAREAMFHGLVTRVVEAPGLDLEVERVLAALTGKSPVGMRLGKEAFYAMGDMGFEEALDYLSGKLGEVAATEDAKEGITAFLEKRPPVYVGR